MTLFDFQILSSWVHVQSRPYEDMIDDEKLVSKKVAQIDT